MSRHRIVICVGSSCFARGNARNVELAERFLAEHGLQDEGDLVLEGSLCTGNCTNGPVVIVDGESHFHVGEKELLSLMEGLFAEQQGRQ